MNWGPHDPLPQVWAICQNRSKLRIQHVQTLASLLEMIFLKRYRWTAKMKRYTGQGMVKSGVWCSGGSGHSPIDSMHIYLEANITRGFKSTSSCRHDQLLMINDCGDQAHNFPREFRTGRKFSAFCQALDYLWPAPNPNTASLVDVKQHSLLRKFPGLTVSCVSEQMLPKDGSQLPLSLRK